MAISPVAVAAKITAAIINAIINAVNAQGMTRIVPTIQSGTGVSVGANGVVILSGATGTFIINGCFSGYENVRAIINVPTTSAANILSLQLAAAGVADTTATNYDTVANAAAGTNGANWALLGGVRATYSAILDFFGAALAAPTRLLGVVVGYNAAGASGASNTLANNHRASTAYDGLVGIISTGSVTGKIRFYGWNDN